MLPEKRINYIVSRENTVQAALAALASQIAGRARANLASHRQTGAAHITVTHGRVDSYVNLVDPAAVSIEFGHFVGGKYAGDTPKYVPGLYILSRAAGLI